MRPNQQFIDSLRSDFLNNPPDASTLLFLNPTSGDTDFIDLTGNHTMYQGSVTTIDTSQSMFNGASLYRRGLTASLNSSWIFGTSSFTMDGWFRTPASGGANFGFAMIPYEVGGTLPGLKQSHQCSFEVTNTGYMEFSQISSQTGPVYRIRLQASISYPSPSTWFHVALVRDSSTWNTAPNYGWYMFVDGVPQTVSLVTGSWTASIIVPSAAGGGSVTMQPRVPSNVANTYTINFNGYSDMLRVSTVARWTATFSAPDYNYYFNI